MADLVTSARCAYQPTLASVTAAYLAELIKAASRAIQRLCGRDFVAADYSEYYDGPKWPSATIQLRQFPVNEVYRIASSVEDVLWVRNTDETTNQRATVQTTGAAVKLVRVASAVTTTSTLAYATYTTLDAMAAAINALGGGWVATVESGYGSHPSADLRTLQGAYSVLGTGGPDLQMFTEDLPATTWRLDESSGILFFEAAPNVGPLEVWVKYNAGWTTVPEDVQEACVQLVLDLYQSGQRDGTLESEKLGEYQYKIAQGEGSMVRTPKIMGLLSAYIDDSKIMGGF